GYPGKPMKSMGILGIFLIAFSRDSDILVGSDGFFRYYLTVGGIPLSPGIGVMAKKKPPIPKPDASDERVVIVHLKGSPAYADWLDRVHKSTHIPKASMFRLAMSEWAQRNGHPAPPDM